MYPQQPWLIRMHAENVQREMERGLRLQQARMTAQQNHVGVISRMRRSIGQILIATGKRIAPVERTICDHTAGVEIELAR